MSDTQISDKKYMLISDKKYTLNRILRDFDPDSLAEEMIEVLAENTSFYLKYTKDNWTNVTGGNELPASLSSVTDPSHGNREPYLVWISRSTEPDNDRYIYDPQILIDEKRGELVRTCCTCDDFRNDRYSCRHLLRLLAAYMLKRDGRNAFEGTDFEKIIIRKSGVRTPFLPDILRKTDDALQAFKSPVAAKSGMETPLWSSMAAPKFKSAKSTIADYMPSPAKMVPLSAEIVLTSHEDDCLGVEIKAGPGKHYVVKKMDELLNAYRKGTTLAFTGKVSALAGRDQYETSSRPVLDYLNRISQIADSASRQFDYYDTSRSSNDRRTMLLCGNDLDRFMQLLSENPLPVSGFNRNRITIDLTASVEPLHMTKQTYGASLSIPPMICLGRGMDKIYILQNDVILCLPYEQWEMWNTFDSSFSGNREEPKELYIQDKDLPAVIENLTAIGVTGIDLYDYIPEIPVMRIYLDYPQSGMISCGITAEYKRAGVSVSVFDRDDSQAAADKDSRRSMADRNKPAAGAAKPGVSAFRRNLPYEQKFAEEICPVFTSFDRDAKLLYLSCDTDELYEFLTQTLPMLSEKAEIMISEQLKRLKVRPAGTVNVGVNLESGNLVMSLKSNVLSKEELMEVLSSYSRKKRYTRLKNGEFITLNQDESAVWEMLAESCKAYGKKNPEAIKMPLFRALYLEEMLSDRNEFSLEFSDTYRTLLENIKEDSARRYPVPDTLKDILRSYQIDGFNWISMLKEYGFGGILADDMGLGKTLQVLCFLLAQKLSGKSGADLHTLIVAPASLVYNWQKEIRTFTPELTCQVIAGTAAERHLQIGGINESDCDIFITSYDLLKRDLAVYENISFANEIIDEAQFIKNQGTQSAKAVRLVNSGFRMALTGTPVENRLSELWSIFDYLMPGFLYSYSHFRAVYETPVVSNKDAEAMERLRHLVHPFILRRLKSDVLKDLPEKLEEVVSIHLEGEQRKLYDAYAERLKLSLDKQSDAEFHEHKLEVLAELTKLRQICCGPGLFLDNYKGPNSKEEACMELVSRAIDGGHKVLLFSQYTRVLDSLGIALKKEKINYHRIDGSTKKEDRMSMVDSFASDDVPLFLISLKAGGTGLNLTAADIVIHYDPWWNIAAQNQATDRAHRIGQTNTVTVYQLIAENSIEEQIVNLQKSKAQLAEDILSGEGIASIMIDKNDLLGLL